MAAITIFGQGNMGQAIGGNFADAGNDVTYVEVNDAPATLGDIVVLAVPYAAIADILATYADALAGKVVIDITNPVNFETFDDLVVPADSSAAAHIAAQLPNSEVVKAFNTTFAGTLASKKVADQHQTTVLIAGDSQQAKETVTDALANSGLAVLDAGSLKRAREMEALGFLQISLAGAEKISWTGGFGIFN